MPMSTIVPMAMAMPDNATTFASTPENRMQMKEKRTARGSTPEINAALRRWSTIKMTTMMVTRICCRTAFSSVPRVS